MLSKLNCNKTNKCLTFPYQQHLHKSGNKILKNTNIYNIIGQTWFDAGGTTIGTTNFCKDYMCASKWLIPLIGILIQFGILLTGRKEDNSWIGPNTWIGPNLSWFSCYFILNLRKIGTAYLGMRTCDRIAKSAVLFSKSSSAIENSIVIHQHNIICKIIIM